MMKENIKKLIKEADSSRYAGYYSGPLTMGEKDWDKSALGPFIKKVSNFFNADLQYDSYDGSLDSHKKDRKKLEAKSKKISKYNKNHHEMNDEDGGNINQTPGKGLKIVPIKEWVELDRIDLNEDLAVWFGKKKKPKGSKQPKGPWVNICRKVDGKHPPCGRSDTSKGAYPKCRAAGVAGKMSDSEKRSACQQKRRAEKKDTQTGKGQKPIMTSYKKKKTNEDMKRIVRLTENDLSRIVKRVLKESEESIELTSKGQLGDIITSDYKREKKNRSLVRLTATPDVLENEFNKCISGGKYRKDDKRLYDECLKNNQTLGRQQWADLIYGYEGFTDTDQSSYVKVSKNYKWPTKGGSDNFVISLNCNTNQLKYAGMTNPDVVQQTTDMLWLSTWCPRIDWSSRVGTERRIFRNPKDLNP